MAVDHPLPFEKKSRGRATLAFVNHREFRQEQNALGFISELISQLDVCGSTTETNWVEKKFPRPYASRPILLPMIQDHLPDLIATLRRSDALLTAIEETGDVMIQCGHKPLIAGNGGSAADAMHLVEELVGSFDKKRYLYPAIALCADSTLLLNLHWNNYGFEKLSPGSRGIAPAKRSARDIQHERQVANFDFSFARRPGTPDPIDRRFGQ